MKNVFIIHSYNGDTAYSFAHSIKKLCKENNIDYYFPEFPIRSEATYESWENILNDYKEKGILNSDLLLLNANRWTHCWWNVDWFYIFTFKTCWSLWINKVD